MRWYGLVLGALCAPMIATPAAARERIAMLVVQQGGPSMASDLTVRDRLAARGFTVRLADQSADPLTAREAALVVISATVSAKSVKPGWRGLAVPLVTWENDLLDDLAMTGKRHDSDFGEAEKERYLWIVNAPQPMAAGLPAGIVDVYARQAPMSWGKPGLGATIIATIRSGSSPRGLSSVTTMRSAPASAIAAISGRLPASRSPPQPNTHHRAPRVCTRSAASALASASGVCA